MACLAWPVRWLQKQWECPQTQESCWSHHQTEDCLVSSRGTPKHLFSPLHWRRTLPEASITHNQSSVLLKLNSGTEELPPGALAAGAPLVLGSSLSKGSTLCNTATTAAPLACSQMDRHQRAGAPGKRRAVPQRRRHHAQNSSHCFCVPLPTVCLHPSQTLGPPVSIVSNWHQGQVSFPVPLQALYQGAATDISLATSQ